MKETIDLFGKILTNILTALYEPFGFSLFLSFFAMFFYLYAYEPTAAGKGWKSAIVTWYQKFKESVFFRKMFLLVFVTSMILFRTLLNRNLWLNPLSNVMGGWGIWETVNGEQKLTTECISNKYLPFPTVPFKNTSGEISIQKPPGKSCKDHKQPATQPSGICSPP